MRKPGVSAVAAGKVPAGRLGRTPAELICLALVLAVAVLAFRIASIW